MITLLSCLSLLAEDHPREIFYHSDYRCLYGRRGTITSTDAHVESLKEFISFLGKCDAKGKSNLDSALESLLTFGPDKDEVNFWPADTDTQLDDGIFFPFGTNIKNLITRHNHASTYKHTLEFLEKRHEGLVLYGSPGIGKTTTLNVLLLKSRKLNKSVILHYGHTINRVYIIRKDGQVWMYEGPNYSDCSDYLLELANASPYEYVYLYDPIQSKSSNNVNGNEGIYRPRFNQVVDERMKAYKFFAACPASRLINDKDDFLDNVVFFSWTLAQIKQALLLLKSDLAPEEIEERFRAFGGNFRVICLPTSRYVAFLSRQAEHMGSMMKSSSHQSLRNIVDANPNFELNPSDPNSHLLVTHVQPQSGVVVTNLDEIRVQWLIERLPSIVRSSWMKDTSTFVQAMEILQACGRSSKGEMFEIAVHESIRKTVRNAGTPTVVAGKNMVFTSFNHVPLSDSFADFPPAIQVNGYAATYRLYDCILHVVSNVDSLSGYEYTVAPTGCPLFDSFVCEVQSQPGSELRGTLVFHAFQITDAASHGLNQTLWDLFTSELQSRLPTYNISFTFTYMLPKDALLTSGHITPSQLSRWSTNMVEASALQERCTSAYINDPYMLLQTPSGDPVPGSNSVPPQCAEEEK
jgi:hypothetical protein